MPIMNGLETTRRIGKEFPETKVLVLTQYDDKDYVFPVIEAGASGLISKIAASAELAPGTFWTFIAAQHAQFAGHPEEAIALFNQLDPGGAVFGFGKGADKYWGQLLYAHFHLVDWHGLLDVVRQAREHMGDPFWQSAYEAVALGATGDMETILSRIERAASHSCVPWRSISNWTVDTAPCGPGAAMARGVPPTMLPKCT